MRPNIPFAVLAALWAGSSGARAWGSYGALRFFSRPDCGRMPGDWDTSPIRLADQHKECQAAGEKLRGHEVVRPLDGDCRVDLFANEECKYGDLEEEKEKNKKEGLGSDLLLGTPEPAAVAVAGDGLVGSIFPWTPTGKCAGLDGRHAAVPVAWKLVCKGDKGFAYVRRPAPGSGASSSSSSSSSDRTTPKAGGEGKGGAGPEPPSRGDRWKAKAKGFLMPWKAKKQKQQQ